jgi:hypothetical protein
VRGQHVGKVHPVELVAREDQHVVDIGLLQGAEVLPHGVGRALIPIRAVVGLLGGQNLDEPAGEHVEVVGPANMPVQAHRVELREHVDAIQAAVDAVRKRNIDQSILARQGHRRLGAKFGERIQACAAATAEHDRQDIAHGASGDARPGIVVDSDPGRVERAGWPALAGEL